MVISYGHPELLQIFPALKVVEFPFTVTRLLRTVRGDSHSATLSQRIMLAAAATLSILIIGISREPADCPYAPGLHPLGTLRFVASLSDRQPAIVGGVVPEFQQLFVVLTDMVTV